MTPDPTNQLFPDDTEAIAALNRRTEEDPDWLLKEIEKTQGPQAAEEIRKIMEAPELEVTEEDLASLEWLTAGDDE